MHGCDRVSRGQHRLRDRHRRYDRSAAAHVHTRSARRLPEGAEAGPRSYLGLQVAGFPNLFTITGPGSPSVLCNMPVAIEQHADWITDCIDHMRAKGLERIEALPQAVEKWVAEVNEVASRTPLPMAKHSWALGLISRASPECSCRMQAEWSDTVRFARTWLRGTTKVLLCPSRPWKSVYLITVCNKESPRRHGEEYQVDRLAFLLCAPAYL